MRCDETRTKEIITEMTRLHNELSEIKAQIENKNKELVTLSNFQSNINFNSINNKAEDAVDRLKLLIIEFETKMTMIIALDKLKSNDLKMNIPPAKISQTHSRFTMQVTEKEALSAIEKNLNHNREITKLVNDEIKNQKAVLR